MMALDIVSSVVLALMCIQLNDGHVIKRAVPTFSQGIVTGTVTSHHIVEASGLAASRKHPGFLYTHNDHGGAAEIYVISVTGHREATYTLHGATSNDWEDIAVGPCSNRSNDDYCIYIGDFGDGGTGARNNIFKFPEPDIIHNQDVTIDNSNKLEFSWGQADCETLMVDPSARVYIISKEHNGKGVIAQLPNSAWGTNTRVDVSSNTVVGVSSTHSDPVGGDISPDGTEVLVKTKEAIFYWDASGTSDYVTLLQTPGTKVPYIMEHQGEAVCWDATGSGYYTLGEGKNEPLYHYVRKSMSVVG